jgi:hypothetical protein
MRKRNSPETRKKKLSSKSRANWKIRFFEKSETMMRRDKRASQFMNPRVQSNQARSFTGQNIGPSKKNIPGDAMNWSKENRPGDSANAKNKREPGRDSGCPSHQWPGLKTARQEERDHLLTPQNQAFWEESKSLMNWKVWIIIECFGLPIVIHSSQNRDWIQPQSLRNNLN